MNNKEATEIIHNLIEDEKTFGAVSFKDKEREALCLAIDALEEKEDRSRYPSELHRVVAHKEELDKLADENDRKFAEWEAKNGKI